MTRTWDVFCSVVDNYGDIGVCWRLSRQLSSELRQSVRLWVDDLSSFQRLCHSVDAALEAQQVDGVEIRHWNLAMQAEPADIAVEGFGARLPDAYIAAMAVRKPRAAWINLEYLSAERWVEGCHGLPSPHATLPLIKYFFFPGFTAATGGLLMEGGLTAARDAFQQTPAARAAWWRSLGLAPATDQALHVSLFCYNNAALPALVEAWSTDPVPIVCIVPEGQALTQVSHITGRPIAAGTGFTLGALTIHAVSFLELDQYDRLLWACDVNFVRGEDSFVRAQFAARPLVWQAYPQAQGAHLAKTAAFLERYAGALDNTAAGAALCAFFDAWNREAPDTVVLWRALRSHQGVLEVHATQWAAHLAEGGNLAFKLAEFCEDRLK